MKMKTNAYRGRSLFKNQFADAAATVPTEEK
jgi:hypothetical protein